VREYACLTPTCRDSIKSRSGVKIIVAVVRVTTWNVSKKNARPAGIYSEKFIKLSLNARGSCVLFACVRGTREVRSRRETAGEMVICGII